jgi:hypothetical protein
VKSIKRNFVIENLTRSKTVSVVSRFIRTPLLSIIVENKCDKQLVRFYCRESSRNVSGGSDISGSLSGD